MATINLNVGAFAQLSASELLNDTQRFPHVPSTLPLVWTLSDHTKAEFCNANADRTQIQVKGLKAGTPTVTVTDGILTGTLTLNVVAPSTPTALSVGIKVLPLAVASGDPYGE